MLYVPEWVRQTTVSYIYRFLWKGKPDKIKYTTIICAPIESGGLEMVNIDIMFKSIKLAWLKSISTSKYQPVVNVYFKYITLDQFINFSHRIEDIPSNLPRFYKQMLEIWYQFKKENLNLI